MNVQAVSPDLPRTRRECPRGPCPHVACRYHLWTDRVLDRHGAVIDLRESDAFGKRAHTCVLREAARDGLALEDVAAILGICDERVRQVEEAALARLRAADPGVLRGLLDDVNESSGEDEQWTEDSTAEDEDPSEFTTDTTIEDNDPDDLIIDETDWPEGADDPVSDDTGSLPWSEPTYTDDDHVDAYKNAQRRLQRTTEKASESMPYWCPHCGRTYPGINLHGATRHGCPNPRCAARAWGDRAREQGRHREGIAPDVVAAIRSEYRPGEHGYRSIAREHGLPVPTVRSLIQRAQKEGG